MYNFNRNLERGHFVEKIIGNLIESKLKYKVFYNNSTELKQLRKCDLGFRDKNDNKLLVEVKSDWYDQQTNNIILQRSILENGIKRPLGVFSTSADFFVYMFPLENKDNIYLCKSKDLLNLLEEKYKHCIIYSTENPNICLYKINMDDLREDFLSIGRILTYNKYTIPDCLKNKN